MGGRRFEGLRWFWRENVFVQAAENFSTDYLYLFAVAAGAGSESIGVLAAAASLLSIAGYLPGALLASRLRARKPMVLATWYGPSRLLLPVLAILPFVAPAGHTLLYLIIAVNALRMFGSSLGNPSWVSFVADLVPQESRGRYFASRNMASGVAALVVAPLAGLIIRTVNGPTVHALPGYQVSFLAAFACAAVSTYFFIKVPEPPARSAGQLTKSLRGLTGLLRHNPAFSWLAVSSLVWGISLTMCSPFINVYLVTDLGGNVAMVGLMNGVSALTALIGLALFGKLADARGSRPIFVVTGLLIPMFPVMWALARAPWVGYLINIPSGFLWAGYNLTSFNILLEMSPAEDRESAVALYQTAVAVSAVIGPLLGGYLAGFVGYRVTFALSGVGRLAGTVIFIAMVRSAKQAPPRMARLPWPR
jgi:MFS family permease